jgi:hypothetical protein
MTTDTRVAVRPDGPESVSSDLVVSDMIKGVARMADGDGRELQRWVVRVSLKPKHQYLIRGRSENKGGRGDDAEWETEWSASPRAEGYDVLNRVMGVQIHVPPKVHNRRGVEVANPIHDRDYLYHRSIGIGYNDLGQLITVVADVEIDFWSAWQQERLKKITAITKNKVGQNATFDLLFRDENGMPKLGPGGELIYRLSDADEFKCADRLFTLRNFGGRQAETIGRRRILAIMSSVRTLWTSTQSAKPALYPVELTVVGWRDALRPDERLDRVRSLAQDVFHAPIAERGDPAVAPDEAEIIDAAQETQAESVTQSMVGEFDEPDEQPGVVDPPVTAMPGESMAKAQQLWGGVDVRESAKPPLREKPQIVLCGESSGGEAPEGCIVELDDEGRHKGPHRSKDDGYVWPQVPSAS